MSTFAAWWKSYRKKPTVRPVTWICGSERVLVEDVLLTIRSALVPDPWDYLPMTVGEDSEREIWAAVFGLPVADGNRLVVVRSAERLKSPERILDFARRADASPRSYVVFVSADDSVPRQEPGEDERRGAVVPWLTLGARGQYIECKPFTIDTAPVAVEWVQAKTGMRASVAGHLLNRADGRMRLVRDTCAKISILTRDPTVSAINELLSAQPRDTLVDALLAMDKKEALLALERVQPGEYSRILGMLDAQLDLAGLVHDMQIARATSYDIMRAAGNKGFLVKDLMKVSRHYDSKRRTLIRQVLAVADDALKSGAREGVMEAVIALW